VLQRLANIHNIPDGKYHVRYLPLDELRSHVRSIEPGTIIMVVREHDPNRIVRISHMGRHPDAERVDGAARFDRARARVIEVPFGEYIQKQASFKHWKVVGFALAHPVDAALRVSQLAKSASN